MKVYVLCTGAYNDRDVAGVYSSLDKAQYAVRRADNTPYEWKQTGDRSWDTLPLDAVVDTADITMFELDHGHFTRDELLDAPTKLP